MTAEDENLEGEPIEDKIEEQDESENMTMGMGM